MISTDKTPIRFIAQYENDKLTRLMNPEIAMERNTPRPEGGYGPTHRNVEIDAEKGMLILDLVDEQIIMVEVLNRDEVRDRLNSVMPLPQVTPSTAK